MDLTDEQKQIMDGAKGPFLAKCMRWLVEWGDAMGAQRLIPVTNTHALVTVPGNLVWGAGQKTIDSAINGAGKWIQSGTKKGGSIYKNPLSKIDWNSKSVSEANGSTFEYLKADTQQNYWISTNTETGSWRDLFELKESFYRERMYDDSDWVESLVKGLGKQLKWLPLNKPTTINNSIAQFTYES